VHGALPKLKNFENILKFSKAKQHPRAMYRYVNFAFSEGLPSFEGEPFCNGSKNYLVG